MSVFPGFLPAGCCRTRLFAASCRKACSGSAWHLPWQKRAYSPLLLHSHIAGFLRASKGKRAGTALRCAIATLSTGTSPDPQVAL
jgi:hypothetical protein